MHVFFQNIQYLMVQGKPILRGTLDIFEKCCRGYDYSRGYIYSKVQTTWFYVQLDQKSWMDSTGESKPASSQTEPPCRVSIGNHNQFCNHFNHVPENFKNHSMQYYYVVQCQEYLTALLQTVAHEKFTFCPSVVALPWTLPDANSFHQFKSIVPCP